MSRNDLKAAVRGVLTCLVLVTMSAIGAELGKKTSLNKDVRKPNPETAGPSDEGIRAISRFQVTPGFNVTQVAAEPMLGNVVAFTIDNDGTFYTSETYRYRSSVLDIRNYMEWLEDDLAIRNVNDRVDMLKKHLGDQVEELAVETEVIRKIVDSDSDGVADSSEIFADGFDSILDGIASGVLTHNDKVYFTNIPSVWVLEDRDNDGFAETRDEMSTGYGVRFSLTGHDLHGLIIGPDGRLYFSCGDRGASVLTKEGKLLDIPDEGGVFRCELDGSKLELFATGLRNPQELAFDEFGNLFTGDNDSDQGDRERLVYVMEGSDSGWRVGYQHNPLGSGGPWNRELLWRPHFDGRAAYCLPPITNIDNGPSGIVYNYGTGLPKEYDGAILVTHFNGTTSRSGITAYRVAPGGAGFSIVQDLDDKGREIYDHVVWNCLPTDVDFGPDGALYWTDWNSGWPKSNKGRIYRLAHEDELQNPIVAETSQLLRDGFEGRESKDLLQLLGHQNMKVRLEAQWELANRGRSELSSLREIAYNSKNLHARIHAIWATGQIARKTPHVLSDFLGLKASEEEEVKVQLARIIGDANYAIGRNVLIDLLSDTSSRVQSLAAISLGKLGENLSASKKISEIAIADAGSDPWLRHALSYGMSGTAKPEEILELTGPENSPALQMVGALALRMHESDLLSNYLNISERDPLVVAEAARAINDLSIETATPSLAKTLDQAEKISSLAKVATPKDRKDLDRAFRNKVEPTISRGINAAFRIGSEETATDLSKIASNNKIRNRLRIQALNALKDWQLTGVTTVRRDRVVGTFRPIKDAEGKEISSRKPDHAIAALESIGEEVIASKNDKVIETMASAAKNLDAKSLSPLLSKVVLNSGFQGRTRAAALDALGTLGGADLFMALNYSLKASDDRLKEAALKLLPQINIVQAVKLLKETLNKGSVGEKQAAYQTLAFIDSEEAEALLLEGLDGIKSGELAKELQLDVLDAMSSSSKKSLTSAVKAYEKTLDAEDWKSTHSVTLVGGNAESGEKVFRENQTVQCMRCHMAGGSGGEVGPVLDGIGSKYSRMQILESIAAPNSVIADGYETVIVETLEGVFAGTIAEENDDVLIINTPDEGPVEIDKAMIDSRERGPSGMPGMLHLAISKKELRDLVEFLSSLK